MMKGVRRFPFCGLGLAFLVSAVSLAVAAPPSTRWVDGEGFRGLPWGSSVERAKEAFPDLFFVRYAITSEKEEPSTIYERKQEELKIDGVRFDEILYWFRNGCFRGVTATLGSKVGPRTLGTPAADGFDRLLEKFNRMAGPPVEDRTKRGPMGGDRKGVWKQEELSIELKFFEPPGSNGEELVLKVLKGTK